MDKEADWSFSGETGYHVKYNLGICRESISCEQKLNPGKDSHDR
jgi:hypothetical protein